MNFLTKLAVCAGLFAAVGCGGGESGDAAGGTGKPMTIVFENAPTNLDPRVGNDQASGRVGDLMHSGLIKPSTTGDYDPDIAERWETPDDLTIVFHMKPNARFHNGQPVTSADVKWTYESMLAEDFNSPKKAGYNVLDRIETPDPHTVVFRLKEPNGGMFDNLTVGIIPQGTDTDVFRREPIGAGPYQVTSFSADEAVELRAFAQHHDGKPAIDDVTLRVIPDSTTRVLEMERGTIDLAVNQIPYDNLARFADDPRLKIVEEPGAAYQYIAFNLKDPILSKLEVRQAIAHAIDRERIVRDLLLGYGTVTETMFPAGHWARAEGLPAYPYNPERAKQLLDAAGYPDPDGDGPQPRMSLSYSTSTDTEANQQAQMIQQMLRRVGVELEIRSNEFGTFYEDIQNGRFQMYSLRRLGIADPDFYYVIFHTDSFPPEGQNRGYFSNPEVDQLIETGRATFDKEKRKVAYQKIQQILARDLPYISLYHRKNVAIMDKDLEGYQMYPSGFLLSVPKMSWGSSGQTPAGE